MSDQDARVLVVDDDGDLRTLVRLALELHGGLVVAGEAGDGKTAIAAAASTQPDIVVLDLGLPDVTGFDVLTGIREAAPSARIVIFSGTDPHSAADSARQRGADHYVFKDGDIGLLVKVVAGLSAERRLARSAQFEAISESPRAARGFIEALCEEWGYVGLVDTAKLVVSELVTNAVVHAASSCDVRVAAHEGLLRIEVEDHSLASPEPQPFDTEALGGRGLFLIAALSEAWGVDPVEGGKVVWAELSA
jgi:DNA-binding response OmpR family regulator